MTKKSLFLFLQPPPYPGYLNEHHEYKVCIGVRFLYRPGWLFTGPALCNWRFPARPEFIPSHKSFGSHPGVTVSAPTTTRRLPQKASILPPSVCDPFLATITPVVSHFLDALLFFAATPCLMLPSPHIWRLRLCRYFHGLPFTPRQTHTFICLFIHNFFACFNYDFFYEGILLSLFLCGHEARLSDPSTSCASGGTGECACEMEWSSKIVSCFFLILFVSFYIALSLLCSLFLPRSLSLPPLL